MTKPIMFNTEMVRAILEDRKTVTRRVVKPRPILDGQLWTCGDARWSDMIRKITPMPGHSLYNRMPYRSADILYVRETWKIVDFLDGLSLKFEYAADGKISDFIDFTSDRLQKFLKYINRKKWCPARFMPCEAARIFLRVTDVWVVRLQDIGDCTKEGIAPGRHETAHMNDYDERCDFKLLWDSTIKPAERALYGWEDNPWVWVIAFEKITKEEATT